MATPSKTTTRGAASPWSLHANALNLMAQRGETTAMKRAIDSGAFAVSRGAAAPSRHRRDSRSSDEVVGGLFFDFEPFRIVTRCRTQARTSTRRTATGFR